MGVKYTKKKNVTPTCVEIFSVLNGYNFILTLRKVGAHFGLTLSQSSTQHKLYNIVGDVYMQEAFPEMNYSKRH